MKKLFSPASLDTDVAALFLRLIYGGLFIHYGYMKIKMYDIILPQFGDIIGIGAELSFNLVIFAEFFCGIFLVLGFLTRLSIIPPFITMIVAFFIAHAADPFDAKQVAFIFLVLCLPVFVLGSGKYSVDALIFKNKNTVHS
ncbi:MAG: DoxX family protein [Flavobacterium sp.]